MAICEFCGKEHDGSYGSGRFCSKSCNRKWSGLKAKETFKKNFVYEPRLEKRICPKCGKEFLVDNKKESKHRRVYCSRHCANGRVHSDSTKEKIRQAVNTYNINKGNAIRQKREDGTTANKRVKPIKKICCICDKEFDYYYFNNRHTCYNPECVSKYLSLKIKETHKVGGYRQNSGNGKAGWYKGISCQSSYELAWVIYNIDHSIKFSKCKRIFYYELDGQKHKYFPDFELEDGTIVEIKGYYQPTVTLKEKAVLSAGYNYKILYKKDLKYCFDYIKETYGVSQEDIITMYDSSKGYIEKTCCVCGKTFKTRNKNQMTCSRTCNGKYKTGNQCGRHLVNDKLGIHKIIKNEKEIEKLLQEGWRFGIKPNYNNI